MSDTKQNPLSMPDDDVSEVDWDSYLEEDNAEESTTDENTDDAEESSEEDTEKVADQEDKEEVEEEESTDEVEEQKDEDESVDPDLVKTDSQDDVDEEPEDSNKVEDADKDSSNKETEKPAVDYKAEYERLTAPFKASGREMKVDNVDEAVSLMQMGVDYAKKMTALKPTLRMVKTLEKNGLLSEEKINYLIDLSKNEPDAIKKLIQESKVNLNDFDPEEKVDYKSNTYTATDEEVELEGILASIRDTESYGATLQVLSNKWDEKSRNYLLNVEPKAITMLHQHISNGVYDKVMAVVDKKRLLSDPEFRGLSDLEAYDKAGRMLFDSNAAAAVPQQPVPPAIPKAKTPDPRIIKKKKAAAPTKGSAPTKTETDYNPLSMSDEDFAKLALPR